jgi:hypothetical protein
MNRSAARANLLHAVRAVTALFKAAHDYERGLGAVEAALRTVNYYERTLNRAVLGFYRGDIEAGAFIDRMLSLIEDQFRRAWNEGARDVGYSPQQMTDDDLLVLLERTEQEKEYILDFAAGIEKARFEGGDVRPFQDRVGMWAGRYNEVRDMARAHFGGKTRLAWTLGLSEHCESCLRLDGVVATAEDWAAARARGIYPRSRSLACGGYRCQCSLEPTTAPLTPGGIPL